ncbi:MAG: ATP-binding protein [Cryomorphaceae bacterium]
MYSLENKGQVLLENCEDEPIHLLGKLQSHGLLFGFNHHLKLTHFSANAKHLLGDVSSFEAPVELSSILGTSAEESAREFLKSAQPSFLRYDHMYTILAEPYRIAWSLNDDQVLLAELERVDPSENSASNSSIAELQGFIQNLRSYHNEEDIAVQVVAYFRKLTGFDRVMYYKFDHNGDGEVLAEDKKVGLESFLGLRYPATDIPAQARKLYERNTVRSICNIKDEGVPIYGIKSTAPIDLSLSVYRSVSPIHVEYLNNMGVRATHANSILHLDKLWGMIICHNYDEALHVNFEQRQLTALCADFVNSWLVNSELIRTAKRKTLEAEWLAGFSSGSSELSVFDELKNSFPLLKTLLGISGFSVLQGGETHHHGMHPHGKSVLDYLITNMQTGKVGEFVYTDHHFGKAEATEDTDIGGVALINAGLAEDTFIFFYRPEKKEVYNWAGKPTMTYEKSGRHNLNPRKSFELWQETVKGKSIPWSPDDVKFLSDLTDAIEVKEALVVREAQEKKGYSEVFRSFQRKNEIKKLKSDLEKMQREFTKTEQVIDEAKRVNELKEIVMSNMNHEMRTPLNGIIGLSDLIEGDPEASEDMKTYAGLIRDSSLRMLYTFTRLMKLDLTEIKADKTSAGKVVITNFLDNLLNPVKAKLRLENKTLEWAIHNSKDTLISNPIIKEQIIINLVNNAAQYGGDSVHIQVSAKYLSLSGKRVLHISVEDDGPGIPEDEQNMIFEPFYMGKKVTDRLDEGSGLGLYIVKSYVKYLRGTIELQSQPNKGTKFTVSIPIETRDEDTLH